MKVLFTYEAKTGAYKGNVVVRVRVLKGGKNGAVCNFKVDDFLYLYTRMLAVI